MAPPTRPSLSRRLASGGSVVPSKPMVNSWPTSSRSATGSLRGVGSAFGGRGAGNVTRGRRRCRNGPLRRRLRRRHRGQLNGGLADDGNGHGPQLVIAGNDGAEEHKGEDQQHGTP